MSTNAIATTFNQTQFISAEAKQKEKTLDAGALLQSRGICDTAFRILIFNADPVQSLPESKYEADKSYQIWANQINDYLSSQFSTKTELFLRGSQARQLISPFDQLTHLLKSQLQIETEEIQTEILERWNQFRPHLSLMNPPKDFDWFALACSPIDIQKIYAIEYEIKAWVQQKYPDYETKVIITKPNPLNSNPLPFIIIKIGNEFDFVFGLQGCKPAICSLDDHALQLQGNRLIPISIGINGEEQKRFWQSMLDGTFGIVRTDEELKNDFYSCLAVLQHRTNGLKLIEEGSNLKSAIEPFLIHAPSTLLSFAIINRYQNHHVDPWLFVENTLAYASLDPNKKVQIEQEIRNRDSAFCKRKTTIKASSMEITRLVNKEMEAGQNFNMKQGIEQSDISGFSTAALLNTATHFLQLSSQKRLEILHCLHTHPQKALLKDERIFKNNLQLHAINIKHYTKEEQQLLAPLFQLYLEESQALPREKLLFHKKLLTNHYHFNFASLYKTISDVNKFELELFRDFIFTAISNNSPDAAINEGIQIFSRLKKDDYDRGLGIEELKLEYFRIKNSKRFPRKNSSEREQILKQFLDKKQRLKKVPEALKKDWDSFEKKLKK